VECRGNSARNGRRRSRWHRLCGPCILCNLCTCWPICQVVRTRCMMQMVRLLVSVECRGNSARNGRHRWHRLCGPCILCNRCTCWPLGQVVRTRCMMQIALLLASVECRGNSARNGRRRSRWNRSCGPCILCNRCTCSLVWHVVDTRCMMQIALLLVSVECRGNSARNGRRRSRWHRSCGPCILCNRCTCWPICQVVRTRCMMQMVRLFVSVECRGNSARNGRHRSRWHRLCGPCTQCNPCTC
jgi:hypothetical protein